MNKDPMIYRYEKESRGVEYLMHIKRINELLFKGEIAAQLAEESTELAHAALKLRRTLTSSNPTPVTYDQALEMMAEELADIFVCVDALRYKLPGVKQVILLRENATMLDKAARWVQRLEERDEQEEKE